MKLKEFLHTWFKDSPRRQSQLREYTFSHQVVMDMLQKQRFMGAARTWIPDPIWEQLYDHYCEVRDQLKQELMEQLLMDFDNYLFLELLDIAKGAEDVE